MFVFVSSNSSNNTGFKVLGQLIQAKGGSWRNFFASWFKSPAYLIVLATNLAIFFIPGLDIAKQAYSLLWIYLGQSLLIGLVHFLKLMFYRFAPASRPQDWKSPKAIAIFFLIHFGFFHFIYAMFINPKYADLRIVGEGLMVFSFGLLLNTMRHFKRENSGTYNANDFMFLPYVRIFPIHIAIILGMFASAFTGNMAPVVVVLAIFKILIEMGLEYFQQLGISFAEIQTVSDEQTT